MRNWGIHSAAIRSSFCNRSWRKSGLACCNDNMDVINAVNICQYLLITWQYPQPQVLSPRLSACHSQADLWVTSAPHKGDMIVLQCGMMSSSITLNTKSSFEIGMCLISGHTYIDIVDKPKRQKSAGGYPESPSCKSCQIQALASTRSKA